MKSTDKPSLIETVIASGANASYVRTIPKTQTKSGSGEMSLDLGWPPECAIPVAAGGKYPQMADANGVLNLLSAAVQQLQARFFGAYNADFATAIGGYPLNAIVSDTTAGKFWVSTAEDNTTTPGANGANWQSLFDGYATTASVDTQIRDLVAGRWALGTTAYQIVGMNWQIADGRPAVFYVDANGTQHAGGEIAMYSDVTAEQSARETAISDESVARANADTNLQNQINNRIQKTGDTMNGTLTLAGAYGVENGYSWSEALILVNKFSGSTAQILCTTQYGVDTAVRLKSTWGNNKNTVLDLHQDGTITTTHGTVAFQYDLPRTFISAQQGVQTEYKYVIPHNLGRVPDAFWVYLVNVSSDWGYNPGQIAIPSFDDSHSGGFGPLPVSADSWNIFLPMSDAVPLVSRMDPSNGDNQLGDRHSIDADRWRFVFYAVCMRG